jgi:hypothetical protein
MISMARLALIAALALSNCVRADVPAFAGFRGKGLGALPGAQRRGAGGGSVTMAQDYPASFGRPGVSWSPAVGYEPKRPARTQGVAGAAGPAAEVAGATKYAPTSGSVPSAPREDGVQEAEARRQWLLGEIAGKVAEIQQPGLNDYKVLELNGLIIGLVEERVRVERRIIELGGNDYSQAKDRIVDIVSTEPAVATAAPPCAQARKRWTVPEGYSPSRRRIVEDVAPEPARNSVTDPSFAQAERWKIGYTPNAQRKEDEASIIPSPQVHVEHTPIMAQSNELKMAADMQARRDTIAPAVSTPPKKWRTAMGYVPRRVESSAKDADATSISQKGIFAPENSIFAPENFTPAPRAVKRSTAPVGYVPNVQNNNPAGMSAAHDGAGATAVPTTASTSLSKACADDETRLIRGPVHDESPPQVSELVWFSFVISWSSS